MFVCMRERDRHPGGRQTKPLGAILSKNFVKGWQGSESERCSNAHEGEESKCTISHFFLVSQLFFPLCTRAFFFFNIFWAFSSVQFSRSVMSNFLRPHGLQHARPPCPSPTPRVHPNPCPLSWWCHPTISSSVVPVSSCLLSFPTSESFQMSQLFTSGGQVLEFQLQHQSFQWTPRTDLL